MQEKQEMWVQSLGWEDPLEKEMTTPVFLPEKSHGQRSLMGYRPRDHKGSHTTELLSKQGLGFFFFLIIIWWQ
jgi:hypothetical protein